MLDVFYLMTFCFFFFFVVGYYKEDENGVGLDRYWFDSSNVKYCECIDKEGEKKTLRVVFNNGSQYEYTGVDVSQYLLFREDASQGKALNKYIKGNKYEFKKLDNVDVQEINDELDYRVGGGNFLELTPNGFNILDNKDGVLYSSDIVIGEDLSNAIIDILKLFGTNIRITKRDFNTVIRITADDLDKINEEEG